MNIANKIAGKLPLFETSPEEKVMLIWLQHMIFSELYAGDPATVFICNELEHSDFPSVGRLVMKIQSVAPDPNLGLNKIIDDICLDAPQNPTTYNLARLQWVNELLNYRP